MAFSRGTIVRSFFWKFLERSSVQLVGFLVTVILARLLTPNEYGLISLITVFIAIADVIIDGGLNTALIQKKDSDNTDFSTIFFFSMGLAVIMYGIFYLAAPAMAGFYDRMELVPIIRVLSLGLIFYAFNSIQRAFVSRHMLFRQLFLSSLVAVAVSGAIGVAMAFKGYGVWALVAQNLSNQFLVCLIMWFTVRWRPIKVFSKERFRGLFGYGWKIMGTNLITGIFVQVRKLLIGKFYKPDTLAYYEKGGQIPDLLMSNIFSSVQTILFPSLSEVQDDRQRVKNMMRRSTKMVCFFVYPMMVGLIVVAKPLVITLFTEKWLPVVPFLQILCIANFFRPITIANAEAIKALGYSSITLKLEIIKKIIDITILIVSLTISVYAIVWGIVLYNFLCVFINLYPNIKLLNYKIHEQVLDATPTLILSLVMGLAIYWMKFLPWSAPAILTVQILAGIVIYFLVCLLFKEESFVYLADYIKSKLNKTDK